MPIIFLNLQYNIFINVLNTKAEKYKTSLEKSGNKKYKTSLEKWEKPIRNRVQAGPVVPVIQSEVKLGISNVGRT